MSEAAEFIKRNYTVVSVLKELDGRRTELVMDGESNIFIRKILPYENRVYPELQRLKHRCLPEIRFVVCGDGETCVVEERVEGQTLREYREMHGAIPEEELRRMAGSLCDVLEFLHNHGIVHRDLKPSNILRRRDGTVVLLDFGAARFLGGGRERDTVLLGTPGFAPPEQFGFTTTDVRSDLYALGATLRYLAPENCSGDFRRILDRCTEFDPAGRYQSAHELRKDLRKSGAGRRKALVVLLVAAVLAIGGFLAFRHYLPAPAVDSGRVQESGMSTNGGKTLTPADSVGAAVDGQPGKEADAVREKELDTKGIKEADGNLSPSAGSGDREETDPASGKDRRSDDDRKRSPAKVRETIHVTSLDKLFCDDPEHPKVGEAVWRRIKADGYTPVRSGDLLYFDIFFQHESETVIHNPEVEVVMHDCGCTNTDMNINYGGGIRYRLTALDRIPGSNIATRWRGAFQGDFSAGDIVRFSLLSVNCARADIPSITVRLTGGNLVPVETTVPFRIREDKRLIRR